MKVRRLGWAGLEVTAQGQTLLIDYVSKGSQLLNNFLGEQELTAPSASSAVGALVTHLHEDHTDVEALESVLQPAATVYRPAAQEGTEEENSFTSANEQALAASRLNSVVVTEWTPLTVGPFTVTPVPAVDGLGDPQVNWVVEADGQRLFHGGDTLFHGFWWLTAGRTGPIDIAALPVNGAVVDVPHLQPPSRLPADMTPQQAVQAAISLGAASLLPMHFGVHGWPEGYREVDDPLAEVKRLAADADLEVVQLGVGEERDLAG